jgi:hypothetical protein
VAPGRFLFVARHPYVAPRALPCGSQSTTYTLCLGYIGAHESNKVGIDPITGEELSGAGLKLDGSRKMPNKERAVGGGMATGRIGSEYIQATCTSCKRTVAGTIIYSGEGKTPSLSHPRLQTCEWASRRPRSAAIDGSHWTNRKSITKEEAAVVIKDFHR